MHLICGLVLALSSVQISLPAESTGRIEGLSTAEGTNAAVGGATIVLLPSARPTGTERPLPQAQTDPDGRFVLDSVVPGTYHVDVQKTGFVSPNQPGENRLVTVEIVAGGSTTLSLQLQKGGVIAGRVLDPSGA